MGEGKKENRKLKPRDVRVYNYVHKKLGFRRLFARNRFRREGVGGVGVCVCMYTQLMYISSPQNGRVEHHHQSATCHWVKFPMETSEGEALGKVPRPRQERTRALSLGGEPRHTYSEEDIAKSLQYTSDTFN